MSRTHFFRGCLAASFSFVLAAGCAPTQPFYFGEKSDLSHYIGMATKIDVPDVKEPSLSEVNDPAAPLTLSNPHYDTIWDLSLEDAVHITLENSKVMRTLGGRFGSQGGSRPQVSDAPTSLQSNPQGVETVFDPAIVEANPLTGVEGALSEFDAQFNSSFTWEHDNAPQNILSAGSTVQTQDIDTFTTGITKPTASGGQFSLTNTATYLNTNSNAVQLNHDNSDLLDFGFQQRLLRGGGLLFNEIHGPLAAGTSGAGGGFNGVMIGRINMDISLVQFEIGVRNLVDDVENAYWELYFAYRALDAAKVGRDSALTTWRQIHALYVVNAKGGEADKEAQARDQYFNFKGQVEQALTDLYRTENRLRFLMGLAATDGRLIRPKDEPTTAKVVFDWLEVHNESLVRSPELRSEKWRIKQLELELIAAKNLLLPNLDFSANMKLFGLGDQLINGNGTPFTGAAGTSIIGTDAASSVIDGRFPEWNMGLALSFPFGFRKELTTIREQQLLLARERSVLNDQELELSHEITDAVRNVDTQYHLMQTNFNRRLSAEQEVAAVFVAYQTGTVTLDVLLTAQQEESISEAAYYRSLVDYNRAITQVHFVTGSLLEYNNVFLAEGPWPGKAYFDAHKHARERDAGIYMDYGFSRPDVFSRGEVQQFADGPGANMAPTTGPAPEPVLAPNPQMPNPSPKPTPGPATGTSPDNRSGNGSSNAAPQSPSRKWRQADDGPQLGSAGGDGTGNRQTSATTTDQSPAWRSDSTPASGVHAWQPSSGN